MKFCPECGTAMNGATVCACGYTTQPSIATLESARQSFFKQKKLRGLIKMWLAAVFIIPVCLFFFYVQAYGILLFFVIMGAIILVGSYLDATLTSDEYHTIHGTQNVNGEHVCVFCGDNGLRRESTHNISEIKARCIRCGNILFRE